MLLLSIPAAVMFFALARIVGGKDAMVPAGALFTVAFEALFYWWLGSLFAQSKGGAEGRTDVSGLASAGA